MENLSDILVLVIGTICVLFLTGLGTERVTEAVKAVLEAIASVIKKLPAVGAFVTHPVFKIVLSFLVAWMGTMGLDLNLLSNFELFKGLDPSLIQVLNGLIVWVTANFIHVKAEGKLAMAKDLPARKAIEDILTVG